MVASESQFHAYDYPMPHIRNKLVLLIKGDRVDQSKVSAPAPRERIVINLCETALGCGGPLRLIREDISEILDFNFGKIEYYRNGTAEEILSSVRNNGAA